MIVPSLRHGTESIVLQAKRREYTRIAHTDIPPTAAKYFQIPFRRHTHALLSQYRLFKLTGDARRGERPFSPALTRNWAVAGAAGSGGEGVGWTATAAGGGNLTLRHNTCSSQHVNRGWIRRSRVASFVSWHAAPLLCWRQWVTLTLYFIDVGSANDTGAAGFSSWQYELHWDSWIC